MKTLIIICAIIISARTGYRMVNNFECMNYGSGTMDAVELIALAIILRCVSL